MRSNGLFILILMFLSYPLPSVASNAEDIFFLCKNPKYTRWLRAYKLDNGKCMTTYSKDGYLQVISSATYFASCEAVLHNVRKNIEEGGFKCNRLETYSYLDLE